LALRFALRELRGGLRGFRVFLACLALGVAAIAGVGALSASISDGLEGNARAMLGGDIEISQTARGLADGELAYLTATSAAVALSREMRAMARLDGGGTTLVELKGVPERYPLYGAVVLDPPMTLRQALGMSGGRWGAVAEDALFTRLNAKLGDTVRIGDADFILRARIVREPDRVANAFSLGPRLMLGDGGLDAAGLVRQGSLVRFKYRIRLDPKADVAEWTAGLRAEFPDGLWRVRNALQAQPSISLFIDRLAVFLTLAGVTALLVGGIGVGNAVQSYLAGKTETIATLKCLGAPGGLVFRIYLTQVGLLSAAGIAIGLALGALAPFLGAALFADNLPVRLTPGFHPAPLAVAAAFGVLTALAFAVWPLARARDIPAAGLFRAIVAPVRRWPRPEYVAIVILAAAALIALAVFGTGQSHIAQWFVVGAGVLLLLFRGAAVLIVAGVRALGRPRRAALRLALSNLTRPGAPTASVVVSLGTGLTVLVATVLVQGNLARQISERIPEVAPAFFFIDIQPGQTADFDATLRAATGFVSLERVPNLRGRVVAINGTPVAETDLGAETAWIGHHEFGFSYAAEKRARAKITAGTWWPADFAGPPTISLDEEMARDLNLELGDTLTFNILGREVTAQIGNLRRIDWQDFGINFFVIFAPGTLEAAPQTHLATASIEPFGEDALYAAVTERFTNISVIRVREVIDTASRLLARIGIAAAGAAGLTIASGVLVLAGAIAAGHRARVYDAVILKVLGATRVDILRAYVLEFALLGAITATLAGLAGTLAAYLVVVQLMDGEWSFTPLAMIATAGSGVVATTALGFIGTWLALGQKPAPVLRNA
jgi:putative ABC transport system permease protein